MSTFPRSISVIAAIVVLCSHAAAAHATLTAYDDFNYDPAGSDLNGKTAGGSGGFTGPWVGQTSYNIGNGNLTSPTGPLPAVGKSVTAVAFPENRDIDRIFNTPLGTEGTSTYVSIVMQPQGILGQGAYGGWFALALRNGPDMFMGMVYGGTSYGLQIGGSKAMTNVGAVVGKPVLLVLRIDFTEGVDPAYFYVNPQPGEPEPTTPSASEINLGINPIHGLSLTGPGAAGFDSLRIGRTFADVLPAPADFDADNDVDGADLNAWKTNFGVGLTHQEGDADLDGDVDGRDFLNWQRQIGYPHPVGGSTTGVPEPSAILLALAGALVMARPRRELFSRVADRSGCQSAPDAQGATQARRPPS